MKREYSLRSCKSNSDSWSEHTYLWFMWRMKQICTDYKGKHINSWGLYFFFFFSATPWSDPDFTYTVSILRLDTSIFGLGGSEKNMADDNVNPLVHTDNIQTASTTIIYDIQTEQCVCVCTHLSLEIWNKHGLLAVHDSLSERRENVGDKVTGKILYSY